MRRLAVGELAPGMVLARDIYNNAGEVMLSHGAALTMASIELLRANAFSNAFVYDGIADDVQSPEILSEQVHAATCKHLGDLFSLVGRAYSSGADNQNLVAEATPLVAQMSQDVEDIIDQALSAQVLDGLISLKTHDNYTFEHSLEVAIVGVILGKRLGLRPEHLHQLALGGILHDIGKLFIPPEILDTSHPLSPAEFALIKEHPQNGFNVLREILPAQDVLACHVAWQHHERQDGSGYPRELRGSNSLGCDWGDIQTIQSGYQLPIAEIAAVADIYSALASDRPYRPAMEPMEIIARMRGMAGCHLNREIVESFLSILPAYPIGSLVEFGSGKLEGYRGVVVEINSRAIDRPVIRVMFDLNGRPIKPFEIDTSKDREMAITSPSLLFHAR